MEVLEKLADEHPVPKLVLEYRSLVKLKNTYLDNLTDYVNPKTGRIHGSFNQTGAATGRLSMSDPNLQNIPIRTDEGRRIRLAFVPGDPENNVLLTADYSQIELRVLAHFTRGAGPDAGVRGRTRTFTAPWRPRCSACRWSRSPASSAATPRRSTSASSTASAPTAWRGGSRG